MLRRVLIFFAPGIATSKGKERKEVTRQTTLFGLPPGPPADKKTRNKKKVPSSRETENTNTHEESLAVSNTEGTQMAVDVIPSSDAATLVGTQTEESQTLSDDHTQVETQMDATPTEVRDHMPP